MNPVGGNPENAVAFKPLNATFARVARVARRAIAARITRR